MAYNKVDTQPLKACIIFQITAFWLKLCNHIKGMATDSNI